MDWTDSQGKVEAEIYWQTGQPQLEIHIWRSNEEGKGHTRRALRELRAQYPGVPVHACQVDGKEEYWRKMKDEKLVDKVLRKDGTEVV